MKVLELFSGTEQLSSEFRRRGHEAFTVDWDEKFPSSLHIDIEKLNADDIIGKFGVPDVIFAAFDCTTFSLLSMRKHRKKNYDTGEMEAISEYAKKCDRVDKHCLELIKQLNPKVFIIENPRGGMRTMRWMKGIPRSTTTYCKYGFPYMKPTDFWSNIDLKLLPPCKNGDPCHQSVKRGQQSGLVAVEDKALRSIYPPKLISHFVDVCEEVVMAI